TIPPGDRWYLEIEQKIKSSRVALLLVSADYLASDFIMGNELPALCRHGVQLAPVLVGECLWREVPEIAEVQWLHDPGADGALALPDFRNGERDRRIRLACERLIALTPRPATTRGPLVTAAPPIAAAGVVEIAGDAPVGGVLS